MSIPGSANPLLFASVAAEAAGYQIERSVRFNSSDSAYLSKNFASAGNRKTFTWAGWVKKGGLGSAQMLFGRHTASNDAGFDALYFNSNDILVHSGWTSTYFNTTQVFRDPSAWLHVVWSVDVTQSTGSDRNKLYINGSLVSDYSVYNDLTQNTDRPISDAALHKIGGRGDGLYVDGYLADIHFIDGQALDPTDFGEYDDNNVWQPKEPILSSFNDGTVWSDDLTTTGSFQAPDNLPPKAFDGNASQVASESCNGGGGATMTFDAQSAGLPVGTYNVRVWGFRRVSGSHSIFYNATTTSGDTTEINSISQISTDNTYGWIDLGSVSNFTGIKVRATPSNTGPIIGAVEIDGEILIDSYNNSTGYGTNGFHLDFSDNSTAAALGTDTSGNSNTWTVNNISVAAGAGNDSLVDVPTNGTETDTGAGGEVRGNYATFSPIDSHASNTFANGNLEATNAGVAVFANLTMGFTSGKWYCEIEADGGGNSSCMVGIVDLNEPHTNRAYGTAGGFYMYQGTGGLYSGGLGGNFSNASYGSSYSDGDIIGIGLDMDNGNVRFYINGSDQGQANTSSLAGALVSPAVNNDTNSASFKLNTGQRPFSYTPPTGHKAMCTTNFADPTIADGSTAMDAVLYTGTNSSQSITGLNFSPDFLWFKSRSASRSHALYDAVRGRSKTLRSDQTIAELTSTSTQDLVSFDANGFTVGTVSQAGSTNTNGDSIVAWAWDGGTSTVTNTDGSITSQVRANASAGFSIVSYTGTGSAATVGHGLGAQPQFIVIKNRDSATEWLAGHVGIGLGSGRLIFNDTHANSTGGAANYWNSTAPTSDVFSIGGHEIPNKLNNEIIAYCFAPVDGYSSFGSYTGNGSTDGPFVYTGFRPRWLLSKRTDQSGWSWLLWDSARDPINQVFNYLRPDLANTESAATNNAIDFLSNGFKMRQTDGNTNGSGGTFIYAAFAESPFQYARAR